MKPFFIDTPSGQLVAFHHIVTFDVQGSGTEEQLRFEVHALTVTGDKHVLASFKGSGAQLEAERMIAQLLERGEVTSFNPRRTPPAKR